MAKRFTDTSKWAKAWFRKLDIKHKVAWLYLCDSCDHAGIWPVDIDTMNHFLGVRLTLNDLVTAFQGKVHLFDAGEKLWIIPFFEFQYGSAKEGFKAKQSAREILQKHGLIDEEGKCSVSLTEELPKSPGESKDCPSISIGIGIGKSKKGGVGENNFDPLWEQYPRKVNKTEARARFERLIQTPEAQTAISQALARFLEYHRRKGTEAEYVPHFTTFLGTEKKPAWRDWLDPDSGQEQGFTKQVIDWTGGAA